MITVRDFKKSDEFNKLPASIRTNLFFNDAQDDLILWKVFPRIGLSNSLEEQPSIKENNNQLYTGFSSSYWDLLTMSMRGVVSCMNWHSGLIPRGLLGMMLDPYVGIVYLTDKSDTTYGLSFVKRAIVRLVELKDNKYALFIERCYFKTEKSTVGNYDNKSKSLDEEIALADLFKSYISKFTQIPVFCSYQRIERQRLNDHSYTHISMPSSEIKTRIYNTYNAAAFSDTGIGFNNTKDVYFEQPKSFFPITPLI